MGGVHGVKETKDVVTLMAALVIAGDQSWADKKVDFTDLPNLIPVTLTIGPAVENAALVPQELGEYDEEDRAELEAHIDAQFGEGTFQKIGEHIVVAASRIVAAIAEMRKAGAPA